MNVRWEISVTWALLHPGNAWGCDDICVISPLTKRGKQPCIFHYKVIITCKPIKAIRAWISDLSSQIPAMKSPVRRLVFNLLCQPSCLLHIYDTLIKIGAFFLFKSQILIKSNSLGFKQKYGNHPVRNPNNSASEVLISEDVFLHSHWQ